MDSKNNN